MEIARTTTCTCVGRARNLPGSNSRRVERRRIAGPSALRKPAPLITRLVTPDTVGSCRHEDHAASTSHCRASASCPASKYWMLDMVKGLQIIAIHFSQVFSPTIAILLMSLQ